MGQIGVCLSWDSSSPIESAAFPNVRYSKTSRASNRRFCFFISTFYNFRVVHFFLFRDVCSRTCAQKGMRAYSRAFAADKTYTAASSVKNKIKNSPRSCSIDAAALESARLEVTSPNSLAILSGHHLYNHQ